MFPEGQASCAWECYQVGRQSALPAEQITLLYIFCHKRGFLDLILFYMLSQILSLCPYTSLSTLSLTFFGVVACVINGNVNVALLGIPDKIPEYCKWVGTSRGP